MFNIVYNTNPKTINTDNCLNTKDDFLFGKISVVDIRKSMILLLMNNCLFQESKVSEAKRKIFSYLQNSFLNLVETRAIQKKVVQKQFQGYSASLKNVGNNVAKALLSEENP